MIFNDKTIIYKRDKNDRSYKHLKRNNIINSFFLNSNSLFIFSLIFFFTFFLILLSLFLSILPLFLSLIFFWVRFINYIFFNSFSDFFYDTRV